VQTFPPVLTRAEYPTAMVARSEEPLPPAPPHSH
jgi:hypothetical protein